MFKELSRCADPTHGNLACQPACRGTAQNPSGKPCAVGWIERYGASQAMWAAETPIGRLLRKQERLTEGRRDLVRLRKKARMYLPLGYSIKTPAGSQRGREYFIFGEAGTNAKTDAILGHYAIDGIGGLERHF